MSKATDGRIQCRIRSRMYGSMGPDPDPSQNVTDPEHCSLGGSNYLETLQLHQEPLFKIIRVKNPHSAYRVDLFSS
jgi:hypothetical protein